MADPLTMMIVGTVISAGTSIMSGNAQAASIKAAGRAQFAEAEFRSKQGRVAAGQERASSQRGAIQARKKGELAQSRALSLGAAGGSASDVAGVIGDLGAYSEYNALSSIYEGEESARQLETGADLALYEGENALRLSKFSAKNASRSGYLKAAATAGGTLMSKYAPSTETWAGGESFRT